MLRVGRLATRWALRTPMRTCALGAGAGAAASVSLDGRPWSVGALRTAFDGGADDLLQRARDEMDNVYRIATRTPESKLLASIIVANGVVYLLWKGTGHAPFMWNNFTVCRRNLAASRYHTLLTHAFSHFGIFHLTLNMVPLWHFGGNLMHGVRTPAGLMFGWRDDRRLTPSQFKYLYISSALLGALASIGACALSTGLPIVPMLGASGAVMGVITVFCMSYPYLEMRVFGLGKMPADSLLLLLLGINGIGAVVGLTRHVGISFAGHLGGMLGGYHYWVQAQRARGEQGWWSHPAASAVLSLTDPAHIVEMRPWRL